MYSKPIAIIPHILVPMSYDVSYQLVIKVVSKSVKNVDMLISYAWSVN